MTESSSEDFGNVPNPSETFGTFPNDSESFRNGRNVSERTENHTLTVREVARRFEDAGVPRTERSIINWCQPNRQGIARLDVFFDPNERKYFITPQSVTRAIEEELAKQATAANAPSPEVEIPNGSESEKQTTGGESVRVKELERENRDLEILTRAKDYYIEQLQKERGQYVDQLVGMSRRVGELESRILQLGSTPGEDHRDSIGSESA